MKYQAVATSMYVIGFAETVVDLYTNPQFGGMDHFTG